MVPALTDFLKNIRGLKDLKSDDSKKKILLIYLVAALLILVGYFYFFLRPSMTKLFGLIPKIGERKASIKSVQDDLFHEARLNSRVEALHEKLGGYEKRLSREKEIPMLLESLSEIAKKSGVKILGITPGAGALKTQGAADKGESVYQEVPIAISAQSGYHELGVFINRLENDQRYMQISDMKITSARSNPRKHNMEFVVYAYTFKQ